MKIPAQLLKCVAGPLFAGAALSCSSPTAAEPITPITPIGPDTHAVSSEAPDPVRYDADDETERLTRTEDLLASRDLARQERIETQERAARRRRAARAQIARVRRHVYVACGRG